LKASSANVLGGAAALKSIHPATNTLSLFDTTAADHDGEKWSPPPKISPQEAREQEAEKALKVWFLSYTLLIDTIATTIATTIAATKTTTLPSSMAQIAVLCERNSCF
jgi:hypothetical protein